VARFDPDAKRAARSSRAALFSGDMAVRLRRRDARTHYRDERDQGEEDRNDGFHGLLSFAVRGTCRKNAHEGQRFQQDEREYFYDEMELVSGEPIAWEPLGYPPRQPVPIVRQEMAFAP